MSGNDQDHMDESGVLEQSSVAAFSDPMLDACNEAETAAPEQQDVESTIEVNPLIQEFAHGISAVPLNQLEDYVLKFEEKLRELESTLGPGRIPESYVAEGVLLDVLTHVAKIVDSMLPKRHRLKPAWAMDLAMNLAAMMFPINWGQSTFHLLHLDQFLDHTKRGTDHALLPMHIAHALLEKAGNRLANVEGDLEKVGQEIQREQRELEARHAEPESEKQEQIQRLIAEFLEEQPNTSQEDLQRLAETEISQTLQASTAYIADLHATDQDLRAEQQHLIQVLLGYFPPFNCDDLARWKHFDVANLFFAEPDTYVLDERQTQFLVGLATSLCQNTDEIHSPDNWAPAGRARRFLETRQLPTPWKATFNPS